MNESRPSSSSPHSEYRGVGDPLPAAVREFLGKYIRSVEQLEILLLVSARDNLSWTVAQVYDVILSSETSVARWLEELVRDGLIARSLQTELPTYEKSPDPVVEEKISLLRRTYKLSPSRTIEAIYKREVDAAQGFADAFRIKDNPQK